MGFIKARGQTGMDIYMLVSDPDPEKVFTVYTLMDFKQPIKVAQPDIFITSNKRHSELGEPINLTVTGITQTKTEKTIDLKILAKDDSLIFNKQYNIDLKDKISPSQIPVDTANLQPGIYYAGWELTGTEHSGGFIFTVFPSINYKKITSSLKNSQKKVSDGTINTIHFRLDELQKMETYLKPYESSEEILTMRNKILSDIDELAEGKDILKGKTGYIRRAFRSALDNTLQPYTVKIPMDYNPERKYPAIVFLHGSDRDDRAVAKFNGIFPEEFIVIAPNGRNPLSYYTLYNAQEDITEAIADAIKNYNIDENNLILSGFSMGGYGVYRTLFETPDKYKAAAVFSGLPDPYESIKKRDKHPDFNDEKNLTKFAGKNIFIFHGKKDRNCPFEITDALVGKLEKAGVAVKYEVDENIGHNPPKNEKIIASYFRWLRSQVKK
jgi:dipeptidyl aminopeptidase/acylaminoacyl peptidase